jgi:hypothetical protein
MATNNAPLENKSISAHEAAGILSIFPEPEEKPVESEAQETQAESEQTEQPHESEATQDAKDNEEAVAEEKEVASEEDDSEEGVELTLETLARHYGVETDDLYEHLRLQPK